ncbi:96ca82bc-67f3-4b3a-ab36-ffe7d8f40fbe [Echria macrotheca]|uniref:96ca82bc-67f3-4b3a-ab36-ffe7d8f40fbe n=1 Tax=Echria macrotheca TaxID=438768 RepID=A0AAJ0BH08_9PEZI|nr:96ca82bc-67f3-4b3a-ab36-ffe7d8f40fbe [Echria macrotheca]
MSSPPISPPSLANIPRQQQQQQTTTDPLPHDDLGPLLNAIFWTLTLLSLIFLALRLYSKSLRDRRLWWDDHVLIAAWLSLCVSASTTSVCVALDYGKHGYDMHPQNLPRMPFVAVFAGFFSVLAAAWSKTSFALTLLRLSEGWGWMRWGIWVVIASVNGILGVAMLFMWIKCRPFARVWDESVEGWCIPPDRIVTLYQWSAGYSGSMDIVLALCPWILLWKLTMTWKEKIGVAVAMSMGVVAGAASFVKMVKLPQLTGDPVDTVAVTIWGGAEGAITIMAASIPVLRALIHQRKADVDHAELSPSDMRHLRERVSFGASQLSPYSENSGATSPPPLFSERSSMV